MGRILIGKPIRFDVTRPYSKEKERLKSELQSTVYTLYCELESEKDHRKRRSA